MDIEKIKEELKQIYAEYELPSIIFDKAITYAKKVNSRTKLSFIDLCKNHINKQLSKNEEIFEETKKIKEEYKSFNFPSLIYDNAYKYALQNSNLTDDDVIYKFLSNYKRYLNKYLEDYKSHDSLISNMKRKYINYDVSDETYEEAFIYALDNRKTGQLFYEPAHRYIEQYIINSLNVNEKNKNAIKEIFFTKCSRNNYLYKYFENNSDKVIDDFIAKYHNNHDITTSINNYIKINFKGHLKYPSVSTKSISEEDSNTEDQSRIFNIKFLNKYVLQHNITLEHLSKMSGISSYRLYDYLKIGKNIYSTDLKKILIAFNVDTYEELIEFVQKNTNNSKKIKEETTIAKKLVVNENNRTKNKSEEAKKTHRTNTKNEKSYNISFLSSYLTFYNIKLYPLAKFLGMKKDKLDKYLEGELIKESKYKVILDKLGVESPEELKKIVTNFDKIDALMELKTRKSRNKSKRLNIDLSYLNTYLTQIGLSKTKLSSMTKIPISSLNGYLFGKRNISEEKLNIILNTLNFSTYEELIDKSNELLKQSSIDISYLKKYLVNNCIAISSIAKKINIPSPTLYSYLNEVRTMPIEILDAILKELNVSSYDEIIIKSDQPIRFKYDLLYLKKYLKINHITATKLAKDIGMKKSTLYTYINDRTEIPEDKLQMILKALNVESYDEIIEKSKNFKDEKNNAFKLELTILNNYLLINKITKGELSKLTNISESTLYAYFNGKIKISEEKLNIILKALNISSYDELLKKSREYKEPSFSILFMKPFLQKNNFSIKDFSKSVGISYSTLMYCFSEDRKISYELLGRILNYFQIDDYDTLKESIENDTLAFSFSTNENSLKYDISFINPYLKAKKISQPTLAQEMGISLSSLSLFLNGQREVKQKQLNKLLEIFNVSSYEELKTECNNFLGHLEEINYQDSYDISFLKSFLNKNEIQFTTISDLINVSIKNFSNYITGKAKISHENFQLLLKLFNVNSYEELKEITCKEKLSEEDKAKLPQMFIKYDVTFLQKAIDNKFVSYELLASKLDITPYKLKKYIQGIYLLSKEKIDILIDAFNVNSYEELVSLFNKDKTELENEINTLNIFERYDISPLGDYLKAKRMSILELSKKVNIKYKSMHNYVSGHFRASEEQLKKILDYFGFESYEELLEECKKAVVEKKRYDISFLLDYMNRNNITLTNLSKSINMPNSSLWNYLYRNNSVSIDIINKLLDLVNLSTYEELKEALENDKIDRNVFLINSVKIKYDISFLKDYLIENNILFKNFAERIGISSASLSSYFYGTKVSEKVLNKFLTELNVKTYDELKEKYASKIIETNDDKKYDISFLNRVVNENIISIYYLANRCNISEYRIRKALSGEIPVTNDILKVILHIFNMYSYDELYTFINTATIKEIKDRINDNPEDIEKYDLSFLKEFFDKNNIILKTFASDTGISYRRLFSYLNENASPSKEVLNKILKEFNCNSYEELKKLSSSNKANIPSKYLKYDLSFLNIVIKEKILSRYYLKNLCNLTDYTLKKALDGEIFVSKEVIDSILKIFNFENYNDLVDFINFSSIKEIKERLNVVKQYNISCLNEYLKSNNISISDLCNSTNIDQSTMNKALDGEVKIDYESMNILCKYFNVNNYTELYELSKKKVKKKKFKPVIVKKSNVVEMNKLINMKIFIEYLKSMKIPDNVINIALMLSNNQSYDEIMDNYKCSKEDIINVQITLLEIYEQIFNYNYDLSIKKIMSLKNV